MKATIKNPLRQGERFRSCRKENHFMKEYAAIHPSTGDRDKTRSRAFVTLRIYHTNTTAYACLWAFDSAGISINGGGKAGGYGYHKASAAAEAAFQDAGVTLDESIGGVGDDAIYEAVRALAKRLTKKSFIIHTAHA